MKNIENNVFYGYNNIIGTLTLTGMKRRNTVKEKRWRCVSENAGASWVQVFS